MKTSRKVLTLALCAVLLVVASVGVTVAYLTSTSDVATNTFTVGNVTITLDEAKVNVYGNEVENAGRVTENTYKLLPGHEYTKDPVVHVAQGSEECYLFVKVVDGIAAIEADTTVAAQMAAKGWTKVDGTDNVYAYGTKVDARNAAQNITVFEKFTVKTGADVAAYNGKTITVQAYAVQADGFNNAAAAYAAAPLSTW